MNRSLRVLYLAPQGRQPGELSRYSFLEEEIRALADAGIEAFVLGQTGERDYDAGRIHLRCVPNDTRKQRWKVGRFILSQLGDFPARNLSDLRQCYRAARIESFAAEVIRRDEIDIIHSYFAWPRGFGGVLARSATHARLVASLRGNDVNAHPSLGYGARMDPWFDRAIRRLLPDADATLYVSEFLRNRALALGARIEASRVIYKGVRLDVFRPTESKEKVRRRLGVGPEPLILAVARLSPIKGLQYVLESLGQLRHEHRFSFIVCGEGPQLNALRESAVLLGIEKQTKFAGRVARAEIPEIFGASDLLVHGAVMEASGNVLLEAMASGLPIVCTDAGGPAEYVMDGVTGFVVPVADPEAMADKVRLLLVDTQLREKLGRRGRERVESHYTYDRMVQETLDTYRTIARAPAPDPRNIECRRWAASL